MVKYLIGFVAAGALWASVASANNIKWADAECAKASHDWAYYCCKLYPSQAECTKKSRKGCTTIDVDEQMRKTKGKVVPGC